MNFSIGPSEGEMAVCCLLLFFVLTLILSTKSKTYERIEFKNQDIERDEESTELQAPKEMLIEGGKNNENQDGFTEINLQKGTILGSRTLIYGLCRLN